ncbi:DUF1641 domain-containing protein [Paenibacillus humicola]|uniref:DUF1641 domain-containing protein n=1 Tax=Paenibacillus humicola TaxID=3110540 RepID=UPI00237C1996|nr:DUF1641 domain-containing protein [Paenibacillus humicola]
MSENQNLNPNHPLEEALSKPEMISNIVTVFEKLPDLLKMFDSIDRTLTFIHEIMKDKESLNQSLDNFKGEFPNVHFSRETLESALILLDKLPKFTRYVQVIEPIFDMLDSVVADKQSLEYLINSAKVAIEPWSSKVRDGVSLIKDIQFRATSHTKPFTLFSMLKLLKDPSVQKGFHLFSAFLEVMGERTGSGPYGNASTVAD